MSDGTSKGILASRIFVFCADGPPRNGGCGGQKVAGDLFVVSPQTSRSVIATSRRIDTPGDSR